MHPELLSLSLFMLGTSCSPGPNNIVASYSGFNFGVIKTLPHMLGVIFGFTSVVCLLNFGLINIFLVSFLLDDVTHLKNIEADTISRDVQFFKAKQISRFVIKGHKTRLAQVSGKRSYGHLIIMVEVIGRIDLPFAIVLCTHH